MNRNQVAAVLAVVAMVIGGTAACGSSAKQSSSNGTGAPTSNAADPTAGDAKACSDFKAAPSNAPKSAIRPILAEAKSHDLVSALTELNAYPANLGLDQLGAVAVTYSKIVSACATAGVKLKTFSELMGSGSSAAAIPCPEKPGTEFNYAQVVSMNKNGCKQSDGTISAVVYGGKCPDGRQFAYKSMLDFKNTPSNENRAVYVVVAPGKSAPVILSTDGTDNTLSKLQMDCHS